MRRMTMPNNELVIKVYHYTPQPKYNMARSILAGLFLYFMYSEAKLVTKLNSENLKLKKEIAKLKEE